MSRSRATYTSQFASNAGSVVPERSSRKGFSRPSM